MRTSFLEPNNGHRIHRKPQKRRKTFDKSQRAQKEEWKFYRIGARSFDFAQDDMRWFLALKTATYFWRLLFCTK